MPGGRLRRSTKEEEILKLEDQSLRLHLPRRFMDQDPWWPDKPYSALAP